MGLKDELNDEVVNIFRSVWNIRDGQKIPESVDLKLGNDGVKLDATVLYADLDGSTNMVDNSKPEFAAEIYKAYLHCAAKIIKSEGGVITSYDGDRIMAVYIGDSKNSSAVRTALKINYAVHDIINPAIVDQYPKTTFQIKQVVGIDTSTLLAARTGVRGANDIVWVGRAANYAAKLTSLPDYSTWITFDVYNRLNNELKISNGNHIWENRYWTSMNNISIYRTNYWWVI